MAKKLILISKQSIENVKTTINDKDVFFQYQYDETKPELLNLVNFQYQDKDGNMFSGVFSNGNVNLNGVLKTAEEYNLLPEILSTCSEIVEQFKAKATPTKDEKTD